ncbi:MAG: hypothetical protein PHX34_02880 [Candidatus Shapirobacteria bacterium]|nr:hypothetical protein [Candidatus Shapirobacteria bacterium]
MISRVILPKDRVMFSEELLRDPLNRDDPAYDKIYTTFYVAGMVDEVTTVDGQNRYTLDLTESPIVVINEKERINLELHPDTPLLNYMRGLGKMGKERKFAKWGNYTLVSGGAIVYFGGKLLCLVRDDQANVDAGCLTSPAGRMDQWLSTLSGIELLEEMNILVRSRRGELLLLAPFGSGIPRDTSILRKLESLEEVKSYFSEKGKTEELELLKKIGPKTILTQDLDQYGINNFHDLRSDQVRTVVNYKTVDFCNGLAYLDKENNTFEFRQVFDLTEPGMELVAVIPGEVYKFGPPNDVKKVMNETAILSHQELSAMIKNGTVKAVPTIKYYLERLSSNSAIEYFESSRI